MFHDDALSPAASTPSPSSSVCLPQSPWLQEHSQDRLGVRLINLLCQCAAEVGVGSFDRANACLEHITQLASPNAPHTLQRLAAVFADALARKLLSPVRGLSGALASPSPDPLLLRAARCHFFDLCPFLKLAFLTTNQAILEAMENEKMIHIIDFSGPAASPVQWVALLHAFRARPEGPPHLRITAVHDNKDFLTTMSAVLSKEADALKMSFRFHDVVARLDALDHDNLHAILGVKSGEALAISCVQQLHCLLAGNDAKRNTNIAQLQLIARSSPGSLHELLEREFGGRLQLGPDGSVLSPLSPQCQAEPKLGSFLSAVRALLPKIMVVTEQDANHNSAMFYDRFDEALNYYASLFDCLNTSPSHHAPKPVERARVEQLVLGEEIRSIVACEGFDRRERHERLHQWVHRMELAGFNRVRLSYNGIMEAKMLLQRCGWVGYEVRQEADCFLFFCWHQRPLYSVSAWRAR